MRPERVLEQHGALRLVVELEVHPVDRVVAPGVLRRGDELAAQPGPGGLRRHRHRLDGLLVGDHPRGPALGDQQRVQAATGADIVVGQVQLGDPRVGEVQVVLRRVGIDQLLLDDPVDLGVDGGEVLRLDGQQGALPQVEHPLGDRVVAALLDELDGLS